MSLLPKLMKGSKVVLLTMALFCVGCDQASKRIAAETLKGSEKLSPKDARALTEIVRIAYDALASKR